MPDGARFTLADEICDFMDAVGYQVDEPEREAARALYPQKANGDWTGLESGIVCPRQNLKTATMLCGALHDAFVQGLEVAWTAHEFKTAGEAFRDMSGIIEGHDWLASEVLSIRTAHGFEGFDLRNGGRLDVIARTGKSGRGMGRMRLYVDEALYAVPRMMGAIVPTMSAMPNAHMVIGSSPGLPSSGILRGFRDRGRSGEDPYIGWIEWSQDRGACADVDCRHAPGTAGCWLDDIDAVKRVNPAVPRRISMDYVLQERRTLSGDAIPEYLRERMGVWEDPPSVDQSSVIPMEAWADRADPASSIPEAARIAFAVDTSWDRQTSWVAVAGLRSDGTPHVEIVAVNFGTEWVPAWIAERAERRDVAAVGLQGSGAPVSSLLEPLRKRLGDQVHAITMQELGRASGSFFDAVTRGSLVHIGQQQLDDALPGLAIRAIGDAWVPDRKASASDVAPVVAAMEALYLLATVEPPAPRQTFRPRRLR